jgi:DNA polymerase-3 subunit alpha
MPSVAITDHGNIFGAIHFYKSAVAKGIKPIIGMEAYVALNNYKDRKNSTNFHLVLLAKNRNGYRNLIKLSSLGFLEGFYYKPRVDKELLREYSDGLIALSACLKGEVAYYFGKGNSDKAIQSAKEYRDIFGDDFYIEIQDHGIPDERETYLGLVDIANDLDIPLVLTNDAHYLRREDAEAHDILLCLQTGKDYDDPNRMKFYNDQIYFKSQKEMAEIYPELPQAMENTVKIAEKCDLEIEFGKLHLPGFPIPKQYNTLDDYLEYLTREGLKRRYTEITPELEERFDYEFNIIKQMGYSGYFLIVMDFIHAARERGIPVGPGRGSAAGSLVAYCLRITNIDPIKHGLLFERFLNPERVSMPDIDIDFCYERRGEVIDYVNEKYGKESVCQIITFGTMKAKGVIRDVSRVLGISYSEADKIAKMIPHGNTIQETLEQVPEFRDLINSNSDYETLIEHAQTLEGMSRHASTHAAGVVIAPGDLTDYVPLYKHTKTKEVTTQYTMDVLEDVGLLKMDFLGLRTLTVIEDCLNNIKETKGVELDPDEIPLDDPKTFEMLSRGETIGLFQLESSGMQELVRKMKPTSFDDITAVNALYRPGPLGTGMVDDYIESKHGRKRAEYPHPILEPILKETHGVILYQEQVMKIANVMAGFSLGQADILRRAMGKKKVKVMEQQKEIFVKGSQENNISKKKAEEVFDLMAYFAGYGFNKCLVGSTKIYDPETGKVNTIQQIFEEKQSDGEISANVLSLAENQKLISKNISDVVQNGVKKVYKIRTLTGREIIATDNHPFRVFDGWKNLSDLNVNDRIAVPRRIQHESQEILPFHKCALLGYFLSISSEANEHFSVQLSSITEVEEFNTIVSQFDNSTSVVGSWQARESVSVNINPENAAAPSEAIEWLRSFELSKDEIPAKIFEFSNDSLSIILAKIFEMDSEIKLEDAKIIYNAPSKEFARQIQHLLLRFGILSKRRRRRVRIAGEEFLEIFSREIGGHFVNSKKELVLKLDAEHQRLFGEDPSPAEGKLGLRDYIPYDIFPILKEEVETCDDTAREIAEEANIDLRAFKKQSGKKNYYRSTLAKVAVVISSKGLWKHVENDIFWDKIKTIEYVGEEQTYDLTIQGTHNFVANDIIVHNSHSAAYAMITMQTAFLKCHYPKEFMAALMTSEMGSSDRIMILMNECKRMGIKVLPPDVNESYLDFRVVPEGIRFGLGAVKNVGKSPIKAIIAARKKKGNFKTIFDFCERVVQKKMNTRVVESLIQGGAFDSVEGHRAQLMQVVEKAIEYGQNIQRDRELGQVSLFGGQNGFSDNHADRLPNVCEWDIDEILQREKDLLGFYISGHPLMKYDAEIEAIATHNIGDLNDLKEGTKVTLVGIINAVSRKTDRKGNRMAFFTLEDFTGEVESIAFSDTYAECKEVIYEDSPVIVTGNVNKTSGRGNNDEEEISKILASEVVSIDNHQKNLITTGTLDLTKCTTEVNAAFLKKVKAVCKKHDGDVELELVLPYKDDKKVYIKSKSIKIDPSDEFEAQIAELIGENNFITCTKVAEEN